MDWLTKHSDHYFMNLMFTYMLRVNTQQNDSKSIDDTLQSFWDVESVRPEKTIYDKFADTITFQDSRYNVTMEGLSQTTWPQQASRITNPTEADSFNLVRVRRYQLDMGIVEPVMETDPTSTQLHYLPYHSHPHR